MSLQGHWLKPLTTILQPRYWHTIYIFLRWHYGKGNYNYPFFSSKKKSQPPYHKGVKVMTLPRIMIHLTWTTQFPTLHTMPFFLLQSPPTKNLPLVSVSPSVKSLCSKSKWRDENRTKKPLKIHWISVNSPPLKMYTSFHLPILYLLKPNSKN